MKTSNSLFQRKAPKSGPTAGPIPSTAKNKEAAEAWMNFMLDGEIAEINFEYLTYAIPNVKIADLTDDPVLNPSEEILERCETLKNLGSDVDDMYSSYWKTYKAA